MGTVMATGLNIFPLCFLNQSNSISSSKCYYIFFSLTLSKTQVTFYGCIGCICVALDSETLWLSFTHSHTHTYTSGNKGHLDRRCWGLDHQPCGWWTTHSTAGEQGNKQGTKMANSNVYWKNTPKYTTKTNATLYSNPTININFLNITVFSFWCNCFREV